MRRDYALVLSATFISFTGDWILTAGLAYQVYVLTGSTLASAAMVLAGLLPQVVLGSFAGVLADRWDRRRSGRHADRHRTRRDGRRRCGHRPDHRDSGLRLLPGRRICAGGIAKGTGGA
jgi:MFS family permease